MRSEKPKSLGLLLLLVGSLGTILAAAVAMAVGAMSGMGDTGMGDTGMGDTGMGDTGMSIHGWAAMALGIVFTLGLGGGLMALVFYSARHGYDDAAASGDGPDAHPFGGSPNGSDLR